MDTSETFQVQFKGDAKTYFGIWIVNLLLSIVTFGIYSAWAKVRTKKYFAQNTIIDDRRFDYHATGKQILIGRLIVGAAVVVLAVLSAIPLVGLGVGLALVFISPYLIARSLAFNARMTSFSELRFGFDGTYGQALKVFFLYPFLCVFTLYLTWPFVARAQQRFFVENHRYGTARFSFTSTVGPFYMAFVFAILWGIASILVGLGAVLGLMGVSGALVGENSIWMASPAMQFIPMILIIVAVLPAGFIYRAYIRNAVYKGAALAGGHEFTSVVKPTKLLWIALSNAIIVTVSWGLMNPWARVRMARYMAASTYITVEGSIDGIIGEEQEKVSALGDAFTDFEGIDVDFAL